MRIVAGLVALGCLLVIATTWGCSALFPEANPEELHAEVESLLPAGARVIQREDGACVELAAHPDCTTLAFFVDAPLLDRERLAEEAARTGGWACGPVHQDPSGSTIECERNGYAADVVLWPEPVESCDGRPLNDCPGQFDHVRVTHGG
jgi:hypothetical protein